MCDNDKLYEKASPALRDLMHEIPELEAAIRKHGKFLSEHKDIEFRDPDSDDADESEIPTIH